MSYGADARYGVNPFEAGLGAFVALDREDDFIGKQALGDIAAAGVRRRRTGFVIGGDRISGISQWYDVFVGDDVAGTITEAVYSPRVGDNIAVGMLSSDVPDDQQGLETDFGDGRRPVTVAALPFC